MRLFSVSERGVEAGIPVVREPEPHLVVGVPGLLARLSLSGEFRELPPGHRLLQADLVLSDGPPRLVEPRQQQEDRALVALRFVPGYRGTVKYALVRDGTEYPLSEGDGDVTILATVRVLSGDSKGIGITTDHLVALWPGAEIRVRLQSSTVGEDSIEYRYILRWDGKALGFVDFWEPETRQPFK